MWTFYEENTHYNYSTARAGDGLRTIVRGTLETGFRG